MKVLIIGLCFISVTLPGLAQSEAELHPSCLYLPRIKDTDIIDNKTIMVHMQGGKSYRMELDYECHSLKFDDMFYYKLSSSSLCTTDSITTRSGLGCSIKSFTLVDEETEQQN